MSLDERSDSPVLMGKGRRADDDQGVIRRFLPASARSGRSEVEADPDRSPNSRIEDEIDGPRSTLDVRLAPVPPFGRYRAFKFVAVIAGTEGSTMPLGFDRLLDHVSEYAGIRSVSALEPLAGPGTKVFPPTYGRPLLQSPSTDTRRFPDRRTSTPSTPRWHPLSRECSLEPGFPNPWRYWRRRWRRGRVSRRSPAALAAADPDGEPSRSTEWATIRSAAGSPPT